MGAGEAMAFTIQDNVYLELGRSLVLERRKLCVLLKIVAKSSVARNPPLKPREEVV